MVDDNLGHDFGDLIEELARKIAVPEGSVVVEKSYLEELEEEIKKAKEERIVSAEKGEYFLFVGKTVDVYLNDKAKTLERESIIQGKPTIPIYCLRGRLVQETERNIMLENAHVAIRFNTGLRFFAEGAYSTVLKEYISSLHTVKESFSTPYKQVEFEHPAYREQGKTDKKLMYFDASLERVKAAGFDSHARPAEAFSLIIDGLEGKLAADEKSVFDDMLLKYDEWLSAAFERKGDKLIVYFDPENIKWNDNVYVFEGGVVKCAESREYNVTGKDSREWIDLNRLPEDFVKDFYGRSFDELPEIMQSGDKRAQVYLPPEGVIWTVGRGNFYGGFYVHGYFCTSRASRGVRPRAPAAAK